MLWIEILPKVVVAERCGYPPIQYLSASSKYSPGLLQCILVIMLRLIPGEGVVVWKPSGYYGVNIYCWILVMLLYYFVTVRAGTFAIRQRAIRQRAVCVYLDPT